jgi:hypothetical protein
MPALSFMPEHFGTNEAELLRPRYVHGFKISCSLAIDIIPILRLFLAAST